MKIKLKVCIAIMLTIIFGVNVIAFASYENITTSDVIVKNNNEFELLDYVSSVNVSCGFHAGDPATIKDALLKAKENPEEYKSLTIRVAGYTAYFVELSPDLQDEIIARTEYQV